MLAQIFTLAKKIHRLAMWVTIALGLPLMFTGLVMSNSFLSLWMANLDWGYKIPLLHRTISTPFAISLLAMMITGFLLWLTPKLLKRRSQPNIET